MREDAIISNRELGEHIIDFDNLRRKKPFNIQRMCRGCLHYKAFFISDNECNISEDDKKNIQESGHKLLMSIICYDSLLKTKRVRQELVLNKMQPIYLPS